MGLYRDDGTAGGGHRRAAAGLCNVISAECARQPPLKVPGRASCSVTNSVQHGAGSKGSRNSIVTSDVYINGSHSRNLPTNQCPLYAPKLGPSALLSKQEQQPRLTGSMPTSS
mmetsp:Transcript_1656/g.4769  ORF Transcript_1656/g.4769 Transcript_1656/m.4769 type:complete len:113 (+) Transcript_1656:1401-1739(+)